MRLQQLEADAELEVPRHIGSQLKEAARQFPDLFRWIIYDFCGKDRTTYRPVPNIDMSIVMAINEGSRMRGVFLERIINAPMPTETPPEPPARTMTERARRRTTKIATTKG
jgi:hypothetical protein